MCVQEDGGYFILREGLLCLGECLPSDPRKRFNLRVGNGGEGVTTLN